MSFVRLLSNNNETANRRPDCLSAQEMASLHFLCNYIEISVEQI